MNSTPTPQEGKFVTRDDFEPIRNAHGVGSGHICSCVDRSEALVDRLLAERDAYREVAIEYAAEVPVLPLRRKEIEDIVDAEAARLLNSKGGS